MVVTSPQGSVDPSVAFLLGGGHHAGLLRIIRVLPRSVIPLSIAGYCFSLGSGDRDRDMSSAPVSVDFLVTGGVHDRCFLVMKVFSTAKRCVVAFIHRSDQI